MNPNVGPDVILPDALTLALAESMVGEPSSAWGGRCFEIASSLVHHGLQGTAVYGHWRGPIAPGTPFHGKNGAGFVQHGWVLLPDGRVLDPTRWVFEGAPPYLYLGPSDHYDEGGNVFRTSRESETAPYYDDTEEVYDVTKKIMPDGTAWTFLETLLDNLDSFHGSPEPGLCSHGQLWWVAHRDPRTLGGHAGAIYAALVKLGLGALIPVDNRRAVESGRVR